jgi:hypothetical protein
MRVQGTLLSGDEVLKSIVGGLSAISEGTTCKEEAVGSTRYLTDCVDHEEEWISRQMGKRPARHTIDHPEEIWPEHFDAAVPPENAMEKMSGLPVDRHGIKIP